MTPTTLPRELPILFNGEMVRAVLDGRKTVTRRPVKPQPDPWRDDPYPLERLGEEGVWICPSTVTCCAQRIETPYRAGDLLYVRETARVFSDDGKHTAQYRAGGFRELPHGAMPTTKAEANFEWRLMNGKASEAERPWRPSILMPKEWARIWLKVTEVRVERLQEITQDDAKAEGMDWAAPHGYTPEQVRNLEPDEPVAPW